MSINFGPSWEIGSDTFQRSASYENGILIDQKFENNSLNRIGYYLDLEFSIAQNERMVHTIGLKTGSYYFFAEYLGVVYKIGFKR